MTARDERCKEKSSCLKAINSAYASAYTHKHTKIHEHTDTHARAHKYTNNTHIHTHTHTHSKDRSCFLNAINSANASGYTRTHEHTQRERERGRHTSTHGFGCFGVSRLRFNFRLQGLGFRVWGLGFTVQRLGWRVYLVGCHIGAWVGTGHCVAAPMRPVSLSPTPRQKSASRSWALFRTGEMQNKVEQMHVFDIKNS